MDRSASTSSPTPGTGFRSTISTVCGSTRRTRSTTARPTHAGTISRHARTAREERSILLIAENKAQNVRLLRPLDEGGYGLDGVWNDDFHHSAGVALTGHNGAYYCDYRGTPQELVSAVKWGYLFQGQFCKWQQKLRGTCTFGIPGPRFVGYLENHDQVANSARGLRLKDLTSPARYRAMAALWLLASPDSSFFPGTGAGRQPAFPVFQRPDRSAGESHSRGSSARAFRIPEHHAFRLEIIVTDQCRAPPSWNPSSGCGGLPRKTDVPALPRSAQAPPRGSDLPPSALRIHPWRSARARGVRPPLSGRGFKRPAAPGQPGP